MSLSTEAIRLPSQDSLPISWKRNPEPWQHEAHAVLREWAHYFGPDQPWVGGQFFYPHRLVAMMNDDHRQWAESVALSVRGGVRAVWIEHESCWEVRAVR